MSNCSFPKSNHLIGHMRSSMFETFKFKVIEVMGSHNVLRCFPKVRTGQPDHGQTSHFDNEIGFFLEI